jgi:hypothetical protein
MLGQDTLSNLRMVFIPDEPISLTENDTVDNPLSLADTLIYDIRFDLASTEDIAKIFVKMGTTLSSDNLVNTYFVPGTAPSTPLSYTEIENHIILTTGMFDFFPEVYLEVWFEYDDTTTSEVWAINTVE